MANGRPSSMIIDEGIAESKTTKKKEFTTLQSSKSLVLPFSQVHSSSSSIDSNGANRFPSIESHSLTHPNLMATISSTTTDSEYDSEQDNDDNHQTKSLDLPHSSQQVTTQTPHQHQLISNTKDKSNIHEPMSRRMKHFQKLFKSEITEQMPELIDSYVCAYQGDILLQGKMYITDRYLCFHSRIISYVTKHVHPWEQIGHVSKERVAYIFPTAIGIKFKSSDKKLIYASFLQRDQAYEKIHLIWSQFHPDSHSIQTNDDDNDNRSSSNHSSRLRSTHNDQLSHDQVLQLCLPTEKLNSNMKKLTSKKSNANPSTLRNNAEKRSESNQRFSSRATSSEQVDLVNTAADNSVVCRSSFNSRANSSRERTLSPSKSRSTEILPINSSSNSLLRVHPSIDNRNIFDLLSNYIRLVLLYLISMMKLIFNYLIFFFHLFKTSPMKISLLLLIFICILIVHSFYLIQLAYRIEHRLQSLHHLWPSSSSSKRI